MLNQLNHLPGKKLVFVHYGPKHDVNHEWVYNDADIDKSVTVWARTMPDGRDAELLRYYPDRQAWLLEDNGEVTLRRYSAH